MQFMISQLIQMIKQRYVCGVFDVKMNFFKLADPLVVQILDSMLNSREIGELSFCFLRQKTREFF